MTRVLHTAGISNVASLMFVNRIREKVSFELSKEIEKHVFWYCRERKTKKKTHSICKGNTSFPPSFSLFRNCMHNEVQGCAEILSAVFAPVA